MGPSVRWGDGGLQRFFAALLLAGLANAAFAQSLPLPPLGSDEVSELLEGDQTLEERMDVDVNGDGDADVVLVVQGSRSRAVLVLLARRDASGGEYRRIGRLSLPLDALVPVQLAYESGVLRIEDLTGTDTMTQASYRFRFDRKAGAFRLTGLDAARYSRRRLHDAVRLNWEPVSGREVVTYGKPAQGGDSEAGYRYGAPRVRIRKGAPPSMNTTPTADQALARAGVRLGQGPAPE